MKNKLLFVGISMMVFHIYIDKYIFKIKNTYYTPASNFTIQENEPNDQNLQNLHSNKIISNVLENKYHTLIINRGLNQGVKINQIVVGKKGFIGIVTKVESNISEVKTFWHTNNNFILVNGKNAYGYLKSNGYYLLVNSNNINNTFKNEENVYLHFKEGVILFGTFISKRYKEYILPMENITQLNEVYIIL